MSYFNHKEYSERCFSDKKKYVEMDAIEGLSNNDSLLGRIYKETDEQIKDRGLKLSQKEREAIITDVANKKVNQARKIIGGVLGTAGAGLGAGLAYGGSKASQAILAKKYKKSGLSDTEAKKKAKEIVKAGKISLAGAGVGAAIGGIYGSDKNRIRQAMKNEQLEKIEGLPQELIYKDKKKLDRDNWALPDFKHYREK